MRTPIPQELEPVREAARKAIAPIQPAGDSTVADGKFLFTAQRTDAGRNLPPYHLVYFLLVDLLEFSDLGRFEKIAWSVPIDFRGRAFLIEHRKFGVGVFAHDATKDEAQAREIVALVKKGVKVAQPYFEWLAEQAVQRSELNVLNRSRPLFDRFSFLLDTYRKKAADATARKDERHVEEKKIDGGTMTTVFMPAWGLERDAQWLALAAIDGFFSWTEHVLIHVALLTGKISTGMDVAALAEAEWSAKFKVALDLTDPRMKALYDKLVEIRRQLRNFLAHGAFGKNGEAFQFHSAAGAVPVLLPHQAGQRRFALTGELAFDEDGALSVIEEFIGYLWSGPRKPAEIYLGGDLPLILTMVSDGSYTRAMRSVEAMEEFVDHLSQRFDDAANMDW